MKLIKLKQILVVKVRHNNIHQLFTKAIAWLLNFSYQITINKFAKHKKIRDKFLVIITTTVKIK